MQVGDLGKVLIGYAPEHKLAEKWAGEAISRVSANMGEPFVKTSLQVLPACTSSPSVAVRNCAFCVCDSDFRLVWQGSDQRFRKGET